MESLLSSKEKKQTWHELIKSIIGCIGISFNQAAAYLTVLVFNLSLPYYMALVFFFVFAFSFYTKNLSKTLILSLLSIFTGAIIALVTLLIPPIVSQSGYLVDIAIDVYSIGLGRLSIFTLMITIISATLGGLLNEK